MGNQLIISMVRGFGMTLGRKAANRITRPSQTKVVNEPTLSKKQLELIQNLETIKDSYIRIQKDADVSFKNGNMSSAEYEIIKLQVQEGIQTSDTEIAKLQSVTDNGPSLLKVIFRWGLGILILLWCLEIIGKYLIP